MFPRKPTPRPPVVIRRDPKGPTDIEINDPAIAGVLVGGLIACAAVAVTHVGPQLGSLIARFLGLPEEEPQPLAEVHPDDSEWIPRCASCDGHQAHSSAFDDEIPF